MQQMRLAKQQQQRPSDPSGGLRLLASIEGAAEVSQRGIHLRQMKFGGREAALEVASQHSDLAAATVDYAAALLLSAGPTSPTTASGWRIFSAAVSTYRKHGEARRGAGQKPREESKRRHGGPPPD